MCMVLFSPHTYLHLFGLREAKIPATCLLNGSKFNDWPLSRNIAPLVNCGPLTSYGGMIIDIKQTLSKHSSSSGNYSDIQAVQI